MQFIDGVLCVPSQTFGEATHVAEFFAEQPVDGICGMAFKVIAASYHAPIHCSR